MKIIFSEDEFPGDKRIMKGGAKMTGKLRESYLTICSQLFDKKTNNTEDRDILLSVLEADCRYAVSKLYPQYSRILDDDLDVIFESIDKDDPDHFGTVNIVSLQCSVLFSFACIDFQDITRDTVNYFGVEDIGDYLCEFMNDQQYHNRAIDSNKDWRKYKNINKDLFLLRDYLSTTKSPCKCLIIVLDYLTVDEIIIPYLDNKYYCGIVYKKTSADSEILVPFLFIDHDRSHAEGFIQCYNDMYFSRDITFKSINTKLKGFYSFLNTTTNEEVRSATKMVFFIQAHENYCDIFNRKSFDINTSITLRDPKNPYYTSIFRQERLFDDNNIGLLIPKAYRGSRESRMQYFIFSVKHYFDALLQFKEENTTFVPDETIVPEPDPNSSVEEPPPPPPPPPPPLSKPESYREKVLKLIGYSGGGRNYRKKPKTKKRKSKIIKKISKKDRHYK